MSLERIKKHLRIDIDDEDDLLTDYVQSVARYAEEHCRRAFISQEWEAKFSCFGCRNLYLLPGPIQSIESITYFDSNGDEQEIDEDAFQLVNTIHPYVAPAPGYSWPSTQSGRDVAVTIAYTCGYGDEPEDVDPRAAQLVRFLAAHWNENREAVGSNSTPFPFAVESLFYSLSIPEVA